MDDRRQRQIPCQPACRRGAEEHLPELTQREEAAAQRHGGRESAQDQGGGVEVLGVHYHFVSNFSAVNEFDGLIVAFSGQLHPAGVLLFAFLLGGLRTGSIMGLQMQSGIPRELGSALIAFMLLFVATHRFFYHHNRGERAGEISS